MSGLQVIKACMQIRPYSSARVMREAAGRGTAIIAHGSLSVLLPPINLYVPLLNDLQEYFVVFKNNFQQRVYWFLC
ncbi:hypothetical protein E2C01_066342 [Portunus trituberculatus]|uniref:Uncharacterized protein n=1 Tax=Portunus trituberculatus TaxID=210409 RepID=A0A5B7HQN8_PORTR|nr:hypothetical protein [Portunus trituberculatus]